MNAKRSRRRLDRRELLQHQNPAPRRLRRDHGLDGRRGTISAEVTVCSYPRRSRYDPLLDVLDMLVRIMMYSLCWVHIIMYSLCWARGQRARCSFYSFDDVVDDGQAIDGRGSAA